MTAWGGEPPRGLRARWERQWREKWLDVLGVAVALWLTCWE